MGFKLAEGKGLREGWDSRELWKSVEKSKAPPFTPRRDGRKNFEGENRVQKMKRENGTEKISRLNGGRRSVPTAYLPRRSVTPALRLSINLLEESSSIILPSACSAEFSATSAIVGNWSIF